jgi:hypothetical protein
VPKGILAVQSSPVAGHEDEYNRWYTETHIPEMLAVPGFVSARRYRVHENGTLPADPSRHTYLAIYEIDADDLDGPVKEMRERSAAGATRRSDTLRSDPPPIVTLYELIE